MNASNMSILPGVSGAVKDKSIEQGSILQNSISVENFSEKFSSSNF
jgi:hypothetical protein